MTSTWYAARPLRPLVMRASLTVFLASCRKMASSPEKGPVNASPLSSKLGGQQTERQSFLANA